MLKVAECSERRLLFHKRNLYPMPGVRIKKGSKTAFIVNGRGKNRLRFLKKFEQHKSLLHGEFHVVTTSFVGHAQRLAEEMAKDGFSNIIAAGGDGTLHEVANGVSNAGQTDIVIGLFPNGTANDYARTMGVSTNIAHLFAQINQGHFTPVNLGVVHFADDQKKTFVNIAEIGLGVDVVQRVNRSSRWLGPNTTFATAIIQSFLSYKNRHILVETDDWNWEGLVNSFVMANGRFFGSGLCIAPEASPVSTDLSVVIICDISIKDYLKHLPKLKKGEKLDHPQVIYKRAGKLKITSNETLGIEADGEFLGNGPVTVSVEPKALNFLTGSDLI